jgi:hypothetical protein
MAARTGMVLLAVLLAGGSFADEAAPTALNAEEVSRLLAGNTLYAETLLRRFSDEPIRAFQIHLRADGTLAIRNFDGNLDTGRWEISAEGWFCNRYERTRRGLYKCFEVQRMNGVYRLWDVEARRYSSEFVVRDGNPEGL